MRSDVQVPEIRGGFESGNNGGVDLGGGRWR